MKDTNMASAKICYTDGSEIHIEYERSEEVGSIASRIEKAIESNEVLIELEDRLLIIPLNNLKYIEVAPSPPRLPTFTVCKARLVKGL